LASVSDINAKASAARGEINEMGADTVIFRRFGLQAVQMLDQARQNLAAQNSFWRFDLKFMFGLVLTVSIAMNVAMVRSVICRPTLSVETAALQLASAEDAPRLIALQQSGDLQMVLRCEGTSWKKPRDIVDW
jgi:hypothetical protein